MHRLRLVYTNINKFVNLHKYHNTYRVQYLDQSRNMSIVKIVLDRRISVITEIHTMHEIHLRTEWVEIPRHTSMQFPPMTIERINRKMSQHNAEKVPEK